MRIMARNILLAAVLIALAGCATGPEPKDYSAFRAANPRSILVVPVINHSEEVEAADLFLSTLPVPLAERGYYVFPVNMVRGLMEEDGIGDARLVHGTESGILGALFGADAILYVEILEWRPQYAVLSTGITVHFLYTLKDARTNELLWQDQEEFFHNQSAGSGNIIADLLANAIIAGIANAGSNYTPAAMAANGRALLLAGRGLPAGPYAPEYGSDEAVFASDGSGKIGNARDAAVAWPVPPGGADPN